MAPKQQRRPLPFLSFFYAPQDPNGEYADYGANDNDNNYNEYGEGFYDAAPEEGNGYEDGEQVSL